MKEDLVWMVQQSHVGNIRHTKLLRTQHKKKVIAVLLVASALMMFSGAGMIEYGPITPASNLLMVGSVVTALAACITSRR